MEVGSDMMSTGTLLSFCGAQQWGGVVCGPKWLLRKPGTNRAADRLPLVQFAPGLLPQIRHHVGFEVGRGVR